jgi:GDP-4-dehydro-6-deoxy-D-mannose reductase
MSKILITGITGMIGSHLAAYLKKGHEVNGISRSTSDSGFANREHYMGDILDRSFLEKVFEEYRPDIVYHLAAQAFNGDSYKYEDTTYLINIQGTRNVLDACMEYTPHARFIPACSSAEYGIVRNQPIKETESLNPITPYGVTKACVEMMCRQYESNYGLNLIVPRIFITVGIGHPPSTVIQSLCMQFAKVKLGLQDKIFVGRVDKYRDYISVEDCVRALGILGAINDHGTYNICSGYESSVVEIIGMLRNISGVDVNFVSDTKKYRFSDEDHLCGDNTKIQELCHIYPIYDLLLENIYKDWLKRLS